MSELWISPELSLPVDVITQRIGVFARTGAGKTYTAKRIVEEVIRARLPVVVIDPNGGWWGLRSSADGTKPGLPVYVLGGEHGHVPLEPSAGAAIADHVIEHPGAYVLDLSDFASDAEQDRFATAFAQRLYRAKARQRDPLLLVVDEADMFCPQQGAKGQETMVGAFKTIASKGRLRGLGSMWITQRPAVLHATVRATMELLLVLQVTGKLDRDAVIAWLKGKAPADELEQVERTLSTLQTGELWASSPAWLRLLVRTKASPSETFDSSKTPEVGEQRVEPSAFAAVDLDALSAEIAASVEQAKANDPAELHKQIVALKSQLAAGSTAAPERVVETVIEVREVPVLTVEDHALLRQLQGRLDAIAGGIEVVTPEGKHFAPLGDAAARLSEPVARPAAAPKPARASTPVTTDTSLAQAVLGALSDAPGGRSIRQLGILTGYSSSGGFFRRTLAALREQGLAEGIDPLRITLAGTAVAGASIKTGPALLDAWLQNPRLGTAAAAFLPHLAAAYPRQMPIGDLAMAAGYNVNGGYFRRSLKKLRDLALVAGNAEVLVARELVEAGA